MLDVLHLPEFDADTGWIRTDGTRRAARWRAAWLHPWRFLRTIVRAPRGMSESHPTPAGADEILERLVALPVSTWTYGYDDDSVRHLGPMAQDFAKAFGLGDSDVRIDLVDANGVLMAACQALARRVAAIEATLIEQHGERSSNGGLGIEAVDGCA